jgi:hypothetical protein
LNNDDMILISVDDHIIEPPDMFLNHLPDKYKLDAPRMVHNLDGSDVWTFRDVVIPNVALTPSPADLRRSTAWSPGPRRDPDGLLRR